MKAIKRVLSLLIAVLVLFSMAPSVFARVTSSEVTGKAGETVTAVFRYTNVMAVQGILDLSNEALFSNIDMEQSGMKWSGYPDSDQSVFYNDAPTTCTITVNATISNSAKVGDTCVISFKYKVSADGDLSSKPVYTTESVTVTVKKDVTTTSTTTTTTITTSEPTTTSPIPTSGVPAPGTKPRVTVPTVSQNVMDTAALQRQIGIAGGLSEEGYTETSWTALQTALESANTAMKSKSQSEIDAAAKALADAIAALVRLDTSKLKNAIAEVNALGETKEQAKLWLEMTDLLKKGEALLTSKDQAAMDACADEILTLLTKIKSGMVDETGGDVIGTVVQTGPTEPAEPYCNIPMHHVWPILFWVSLALNLALITLIALYVLNKKKQRRDDTPLVDYDIGDDEL